MTRKLFLMGTLLVLSALVSACGTPAIPEYERGETSIAVARTETREALLTEGAIVPTDTPTVTPSPTVDFEATAAAEQATLDAEATITAEFEAEAANEQATSDAQATLDAMPTAIGADDPLYDDIAAADPANGELIFTALAVPACNTCHLVDSETMLVGPGQLHVFDRTVERIENGTIEAEGPYTYLYNSIVHPGDYIVESYANAMPATYGDLLTEEQIYDLVAYLATLGE